MDSLFGMCCCFFSYRHTVKKDNTKYFKEYIEVDTLLYNTLNRYYGAKKSFNEKKLSYEKLLEVEAEFFQVQSKFIGIVTYYGARYYKLRILQIKMLEPLHKIQFCDGNDDDEYFKLKSLSREYAKQINEYISIKVMGHGLLLRLRVWGISKLSF